MRVIILLFLAIFLQSCGKPKAVLICGDHVCVNKEEANQYFEKSDLNNDGSVTEDDINVLLNFIFN